MKTTCRLWTSLLIAGAAASAAAAPQSESSQSEMMLWYRQPGVKWLEAMPLGNGLMGAMVFGGVAQDRIALNESSFWSGRPHDYNDPKAIQYFPKIRDLVFAGKFQEAEKMADEHFCGLPAAQQAYQLHQFQRRSRSRLPAHSLWRSRHGLHDAASPA